MPNRFISGWACLGQARLSLELFASLRAEMCARFWTDEMAGLRTNLHAGFRTGFHFGAAAFFTAPAAARATGAGSTFRGATGEQETTSQSQRFESKRRDNVHWCFEM